MAANTALASNTSKSPSIVPMKTFLPVAKRLGLSPPVKTKEAPTISIMGTSKSAATKIQLPMVLRMSNTSCAEYWGTVATHCASVFKGTKTKNKAMENRNPKKNLYFMGLRGGACYAQNASQHFHKPFGN